MKKIIICVFLLANLFCAECLECFQCAKCEEDAKLSLTKCPAGRNGGCFTIHGPTKNGKKMVSRGCIKSGGGRSSQKSQKTCTQIAYDEDLGGWAKGDKCQRCYSDKCNSESEKQVPAFLILLLVSLLLIQQ